MVGMMDPHTPPRKLFKPSSKTKTLTPSKNQKPTTPIHPRAQSHDVFTPAETLSRSTETLADGSEAARSTVDNRRTGSDTSGPANISPENVAGEPREVLGPSNRNLLELLNPTCAANFPVDGAGRVAEQGNAEMSTSTSALAGTASRDGIGTAGGGVGSTEGIVKNAGDAIRRDGELKDRVVGPIKELHRDNTLMGSPSERTKEIRDTTLSSTKSAEGGGEDGGIVKKTPTETTPDEAPDPSELTGASDQAKQATEDAPERISGTNLPNMGELGTSGISKGAEVGIRTIKETGQDSSFVNKTPALSEPKDVSKEADGATRSSGEHVPGMASANIIGEPDPGVISKDADVKRISNDKSNPAGSAHDATNDGAQVADNMGQPAHIERRIEIPLPRPEKVISSPPEPVKPDMNNIASGLDDPNGLPDTRGLPSTDDLPKLPDDVLQDPPEEILDPSVHSPSNVSPIPKIPKITPIAMAPPPDLLRLANGLGGNVVDDVGNIIDASGKVLGHATGDLPAMVGRTVADNGEIYGESGEVIGYVSENFTEPPPPTDIPESVLGGLKVDHDGNILDGKGNIIGRFNEKAGENGVLGPFTKRAKSDKSQAQDSKPREDKKPKVNAHTGGSPSDIFLDVKSTTDGIQLTIRIPTTFGRQPQDS